MPTSTLLLTEGSQICPSSFPSLSHPSSSLVSWTLGSDYAALCACVVPALVGMLWITKTSAKSEPDCKALPTLLKALNPKISRRTIPSRYTHSYTPWAGARTEKHSYVEQLNAGAAQAKEIILHDNEKQQLSCFPKTREFIPPCLRSLQPAGWNCTIVHVIMLANISLLLSYFPCIWKKQYFPEAFWVPITVCLPILLSPSFGVLL